MRILPVMSDQMSGVNLVSSEVSKSGKFGKSGQ